MALKTLSIVLTGLLCGTVLLGQATIPAGGGTSTAIHPDSIQDGNIYGYYMGTDAQTRADGSLLGKVSIAGNPLLWDPVPIHVVCAGKVEYATNAWSKGGFVISPVSSSGAINGNSDSRKQMEMHFDGCTVTAALTGYSSTSITLTIRNFRDAPDIGTLELRREAGAKGTALSTMTEDVDPKALKLFEKAREAWERQNLDHVKSDLKEAVTIDPKFAEGWYQLAKQEQAGSPDEARTDYAKAIAIDPKFIRPYEQLLMLDSQEGKWKDELTDGGHALALDPRGSAQVWYGYSEGVLKAFAAGALPAAKLKIAETSALNALKLDPQHTIPAEQLVALVLAEEKDYTSAIEHLRNCLTYTPKGAGQDQVKQQIAHLEQLKAVAAK